MTLPLASVVLVRILVLGSPVRVYLGSQARRRLMAPRPVG